MELRHLQMLLAATGDYAGGIDGIYGPKTEAAIMAVEARHLSDYTFDPTTTTTAPFICLIPIYFRQYFILIICFL